MSASIHVVSKRKHCSRWPSVMEDRTLDLGSFMRENNCSHRYVLPNREISPAAFFLRLKKFCQGTCTCDKSQSPVLRWTYCNKFLALQINQLHLKLCWGIFSFDGKRLQSQGYIRSPALVSGSLNRSSKSFCSCKMHSTKFRTYLLPSPQNEENSCR